MSKKYNILGIFLIIGICFFYSCHKDSGESISCLGELTHIHLDHTIDADNAKKVSLDVSYTGKYTLDNSINWDFGDGTKTSGGKSIEHTYSNTGTFTVTAKVTLKNGDAYCSTEKTEKVNIE